MQSNDRKDAFFRKPFSWSRAMTEARDCKIRRAKCQAKAQHPDHKKAHADECRDANTNNYVKLTKRVHDDIKAKQDLAIERRKIRYG